MLGVDAQSLGLLTVSFTLAPLSLRADESAAPRP